MKVIHLPTSVGGMPLGLAQGERALGLLSDVVFLYNNWIQYSADRVLFNNAPKSVMGRIFCLGTQIKEVRHIRNNYDVFHFNYGTSLIDLWKIGMPLLDLPFYKGKIVVTYNGCDARQKYPTRKRVKSSACHYDHCYEGACMDGKLDVMKERRIAKFDRYADAFFAVNPDLMYFLPKRTRFLPYTIAQWNDIEAVPYKDVSGRMKIVHSPTNREAKGSEIILSCLDLLKKKYRDRIEVILVENMTNQEALRVYVQADLAIDQILIGWYGGFAVEMMKMGKPVMAFIREEDLKFIPKEMAQECQQAIINVDSSNLYEKLCFLLENPEVLKGYREAALDYVHRWHNPIFVAGITKSVYES